MKKISKSNNIFEITVPKDDFINMIKRLERKKIWEKQ